MSKFEPTANKNRASRRAWWDGSKCSAVLHWFTTSSAVSLGSNTLTACSQTCCKLGRPRSNRPSRTPCKRTAAANAALPCFLVGATKREVGVKQAKAVFTNHVWMKHSLRPLKETNNSNCSSHSKRLCESTPRTNAILRYCCG